MSKHRYKDIEGKKYGRLTALEFVGKDRHNRAVWKCICKCGNHTEVVGVNLWNGYTKSCGCLFEEMNRGITVDEDGNTKRLYEIWASMKQRCLNPNNDSYEYYGGRGIEVCEEWMEFEPFMNWAYENGYNDDLSIERLDNDGNYEPSNCAWTTRKGQGLNRRSKNDSSGITGVTWHESTQKWYARICSDGKTIYGELFENKSDAKSAVEEKRQELIEQELQRA